MAPEHPADPTNPEAGLETPPAAGTPRAPGGREHTGARSRRWRRALISAGVTLAVLAGAAGTAWAVSAQRDATAAPEAADPPRTSPAPRPTATPSPSPTADPTAEPAAEPVPAPAPTPAAAAGIDDPNSISVVVNKQRPLNPAGFAPADLAYPEVPNSSGQPLRYEAAVALERMYAEASGAGLPFAIVSGYRGFDMQQQLFNSYAANYGVASAETFSARPGHSEHQTGLAVDISECQGCALSEAFGATPQGLWARENAHRFGFILRYDQGQQPVVGYVYEPWHFRYVGVEIASDMRARGIINLEEYFGLPAAPTY